MNVRLYFRAEMVTFCSIQIGNRKIFLKHHPHPRVPTNPFARKCVLIFYIICEKLVELGAGGGGEISHSPKCDIWASPNLSIWIFGVLLNIVFFSV